MRTLVPLRGSVLCRKVRGGTRTEKVRGLSVKVSNVDIYKIIELPKTEISDFPFKVGDYVMSNSTGDEIEVNPGDTVYLFKSENIMCAVEHDEQKKKIR